MEYVTKVACEYGIAPYLWDNGSELDRATLIWRTPGLIEALQRASSGQDYTPTKG